MQRNPLHPPTCCTQGLSTKRTAPHILVQDVSRTLAPEATAHALHQLGHCVIVLPLQPLRVQISPERLVPGLVPLVTDQPRLQAHRQSSACLLTYEQQVLPCRATA